MRLAGHLWRAGVPTSEVFGSRWNSTQHRGAWERKFQVWEVLDFTLSSYLLRIYLPGPVVFLDPGGRPCASCPFSRVQVAGSIPFRVPWSLGFLGPDHTQASPLVLLWNRSLYVIQGWGSLVSFSHFPSLYPLAGMPVRSQYDGTWEGVESLALVYLLCGNSHLFSMTRHPAKMPVDLAFFLLFRCWHFQ